MNKIEVSSGARYIGQQTINIHLHFGNEVQPGMVQSIVGAVRKAIGNEKTTHFAFDGFKELSRAELQRIDSR